MKKLLDANAILRFLLNDNEEMVLASGENNRHESGGINQKKSKEKSHYQF